MTVALAEFAEWRDSVEVRLGRLETMGAEHNQLCGAMDRDLGSLHAEFRAQRSLLQALHLTQNEHTSTLNEHTRTLNGHTRTLNEHTRTLNEHSAALRELQVGVQTIIGLLESAGGGGR